MLPPAIGLEPFGDADIERLVAWISSPALLGQWTASTFTHPLTRPQLEQHLRETAARGDRLIYRVVVEDEVVGHLELGAIDRRHRSLRIGRVFVAPGARGRGVGTRMMQAALEIAFDQLSMHRVELGVFDFNREAVALYERVGFRREGLRRDVFLGPDGYWSELVMSILADEWRAKRPR